MTKVQQYRTHPKTPYLIGGVVILVGLAGFLLWRHYHHTTPPPTSDQFTKGAAANPPSSTGGNGSSSSNNSPTVSSLLTPSGDFVSNHHPNLSGSPAPNSLTSVCNTSPGAQCQIIFTNGSQQKSLDAQTTDAGGSAYWNWSLQDVGLTAGNWTVKATATAGSKTATAQDAMPLVVAQ